MVVTITQATFGHERATRWIKLSTIGPSAVTAVFMNTFDRGDDTHILDMTARIVVGTVQMTADIVGTCEDASGAYGYGRW